MLRLMKNVLVAALLFPLLSNAAFGDEAKKLRRWIDSSAWSKGAEYCDGRLLDNLSRQRDAEFLSHEYLARVATYCAALASGQGDEFDAGWWWDTAGNLHRKTAYELLPELQNLGLLKVLPPLRGRVSTLEEVGEGKVRLVSGELVDGIPPRPLGKPKTPRYLYSLGFSVMDTDVSVELVVSRDGMPRQPLLIKSRAFSIHLLYVCRFLSTWRFEPARVNGEPVDSVFETSISTKRVH
jgi:hypothetical protein